MKLIFELKGQEKPACVAEFIALAYSDTSKKNNKTISSNKDQQLEELKNNTVLFKKDGDIAIVTLNRPEKYNAVNDDLVDDGTSYLVLNLRCLTPLYSRSLTPASDRVPAVGSSKLRTRENFPVD